MEISHSNPLPLIRIQNADFEAEILLQGAQLMHFAPRGQSPWIFRSLNTPYTPGREIYGGIPVIFPWFGRLETQPDAPNHGFVRSATWKVEPGGNDSQITLSLTADEVRAQGIDTTLWPYDFEARMIFSFGQTLGVRFEISNQSAETCRFECSLHPYFAVENLAAVRIEGLDGQEFREGGKGDIQVQLGAVEFSKSVSQVFETAGNPVQIRDRNRTYRLTPREGWRSTVTWTAACAMADLKDDDIGQFICVEPAALRESAVVISPGQTYALDFMVEAL